MFGVACQNPEDRATGDADSSTFNSNTENNLNTATDNIDNPTSAMPDSSSSPATSKENTNSTTNGTNRAYGAGRDSGRK